MRTRQVLLVRRYMDFAGDTDYIDYAKTSLKPYVDHFKRHVSALIEAEVQDKKRKPGDALEF